MHIYDKNKFKLEQKKQTPFRILSGHEAEGFSLEWNRIRSEYIVAGSYDSKLSLWDINSRDKGKLTPLMDFVFHKCEIEDVTYHGFHDCIFASCDDDGQTAIWDTRDSKEGPIHHSKQHDGPIHSVQFNPNCPNLFATGGKAKFVRIWDCRNLSGSLFDLQAEQEINQIKWAPKDRDLIWVASDCTLSMWNTLQQKVKFVHAGHTSNISEMDVHPFMSMTVASVDNGNDLQVFQPNHNCLL